MKAKPELSSILYSMKRQILNRLDVAHVLYTMMRFVTGSITRQQAMESLFIFRLTYLSYLSYNMARYEEKGFQETGILS